jgi:Polyketide synthase modules and related proteins
MSAPENEKFAIVGIGCRMPPNANSLTAFWKFLMRGGNALRPIRKDRWDWRQYYDEDQQRPGKNYAPKAASLDMDLRQFDPLAFGMSPREAASLDPQQRLLLEVTWEAFEDAGLPLTRMSGSSTGVFVGGFCLDHLVLQTQASNRHLINAHSAGGVMMTVLSNRISHAFNLKGPSLTLDTACSSSLVALHYACQSLRLRECDMALAGGVNAMMRPDFPIIMSKGHFLSHHGECHAFDETAAGYARGEGAGILLIQRLEDALAAGHTIHAVVCASGVNQDGRTDGISLPNSEAQEALVRDVYSRAGISPAEVDYVEAHGTGTQAGDFAELGALDRNFANGRDGKLPVGSVKTNIGHLEAAAGVAGVLKTIGVLKNRQVPKNLHFKNPNPRIPFADLSLEVAADTRKLPAPEEKPTVYAAINSFGYGGTNAHVVLESAPVVEVPSAPDDPARPLRVIPLSASSEEALRDLAGKYAFLLGQPLAGTFADLAYTTAFRRSHLPVRLAALAGGPEELRDQLMAASTGQVHERVAVGGRAGSAKPPLVFVFTGMGPQWWGMGQELMRSEPVFAAAIDEVDAVFAPLAGWSLKQAMLAGEAESRMARTELAQPANFAIQLALTRLWEAHGIRPSAVVGHSVGEVTSAYVAGVYTLEEAVRVSFHRSRLQQTMAGNGSMLAVGLAEADALKAIQRFDGVAIAAINSFNAVTLSGDTDQLKRISAELTGRDVFNKFLRVEVAYHSPQMDPLHDELLASLADLSPQAARLPLYSTAEGALSPGTEWTAEYWWRNVRHSVRFSDAIKALIEDGYTHFLEVGPHPVLGNSIKECAAALNAKISCFTSIRRAEPELPRFLLTLGELYCAGIDPDWSAVAPTSGRFLPGPQYPWQRQTLWIESERSKMERLGLPGPVYLNRTVLSPKPCWEVEINRNYFPFLFDHGVQDQTVFAGMGYIEAALTLGSQVHGTPAVVLENVNFERVLVVDYSKLQYLVTDFDADDGRFSVSSRIEGEEGSFQRHCTGRMYPRTNPAGETLDLAALKAECPNAVAPDPFYERLSRRQLHYGPMFRLATELFTGTGCFLVKIDASGVIDEEDHPLHPSIFDVALQAVIYCASGEQLFVPSSFEEFRYISRPATSECHAFGRLLSQTATRIVADVWLTDANGTVCASARGISLQRLEMDSAKQDSSALYAIEWKASPLEATGPADESGVLVLSDDEKFAADLAGQIPNVTLGSAIDDPSSLESRRRIVVVVTGECDARETTASWIRLLQQLGKPAESVDVTLVTRGASPVRAGEGVSNPGASALAAVGLVARNEFDSIACRAIDFDVPNAAAVIAEIRAGSQGEIAYRGGERFEKALVSRPIAEESRTLVATSLEEPVELVAAKGRLDTLGFQPATRCEPSDEEVEIRVHRTTVSERDFLRITGQLPPAAFDGSFSEWGLECAGVVVRGGKVFEPGTRVAALARKAWCSYAIAPEAFVVKLQDSLDMDAAAIPVDYITAWRGLVEIARLQPGERVLIPHAAGGTGLAAIDVALAVGAEVFATAASDAEREFLSTLGLRNIFPATAPDFADAIRDATRGEGVDAVIGALTGTAAHAALGLLRHGGRYIETGRMDIAADRDLPLGAFDRNVIFASVDVDRLAAERPDLVQAALQTIFDEFASGRLKLRATRNFPAREASDAFRHAAGIGRALLDFSTGGVDVPETPRAVVRPDGCYIVTGGTSGFGLATAGWLADLGAGRILLVSRSGANAAGINEAIRGMESRGARVEALSVDVTDAAQVEKLIAHAGGNLRGIVHGAMVLDDAMMAGLSRESFDRVFLPKATGAMNLATAIAGRELDFVVFHSSVSALVGNRGQTSYVAANAILDALAHSLRAQGIPAVSINWGALAETGVVARDGSLSGVLASAGITGLRNAEAFEALERILRGDEAQVGVFKVDWAKWFEAHPHLTADPRFRGLKKEGGGGNDVASQLRESLANASRDQRLRDLEGRLQEALGATLKMDAASVPVDRKLNEMGVDSLMVLELSLGISERIGVSFSAMEFLKGPTLQQLAAMAESRIWASGK